jgi:sulfur carrier protein
MLTLQVNGKPCEVALGATVRALLVVLDVQGDGVAIALNGAVLRRGDWSERALAEGDSVEVVRAVGGG